MMTRQEVLKMIDEMKAQGGTEGEILETFYIMYNDKKITLDQFRALANEVGYDLSPEFLSNPNQPQDVAAQKETTDASEEEIEKSKDYDNIGPADKEGKPSSSEDSEDEDEESKAMKLFGK